MADIAYVSGCKGLKRQGDMRAKGKLGFTLLFIVCNLVRICASTRSYFMNHRPLLPWLAASPQSPPDDFVSVRPLSSMSQN